MSPDTLSGSANDTGTFTTNPVNGATVLSLGPTPVTDPNSDSFVPLPPPSSSLSHTVDVPLLNIRSLFAPSNKKCQVISSRINKDRDYILGLTETWLQPSRGINELLAAFPHSNLARSDRKSGDCSSKNPSAQGMKGGGVLLLTSRNLPIKIVDAFSNGSCELLITEIGSINTSVTVIYNPSGRNFDEHKFVEAMSRLQKYLDTVKLKDPDKHLLLMDDFNFSKIVEWVPIPGQLGVAPIVGDNSTPKHRALSSLLRVTDSSGLTQLVAEATQNRMAFSTSFLPQSQRITRPVSY